VRYIFRFELHCILMLLTFGAADRRRSTNINTANTASQKGICHTFILHIPTKLL